MLARTHLPELRRDEIGRALSDIHLPELDLRETASKLEMPKLEMPNLEMPKLKMPNLEMPRIDFELPDLRKAMADAGDALQPRRAVERRRRWLLAGGLAIAVVAGAVIASVTLVRDKALREPLARAFNVARERASYAIGSLGRRLRGERTELIALDVVPEPVAPATAVAAPVAPVAGEMAAATEEPILVESGEPC
jgi:hypothetical protein